MITVAIESYKVKKQAQLKFLESIQAENDFCNKYTTNVANNFIFPWNRTYIKALKSINSGGFDHFHYHNVKNSYAEYRIKLNRIMLACELSDTINLDIITVDLLFGKRDKNE